MANGNLFLLPTCLNTENSLFFSFSLFRKTQTTIFLESAFAISTCLTTAMEMNSKKHSMNSKQHPISLLYGFPHHYSSFIFRIAEVHTYDHSQQGIHLYAIHMTLTPRPAITNHWNYQSSWLIMTIISSEIADCPYLHTNRIFTNWIHFLRNKS